MIHWPLASDYVNILQNPTLAFRDRALMRSTLKQDRHNLPAGMSGAFAIVFQATLPDGSRRAIRAFTGPRPHDAERYRLISDHLARCENIQSLVSFNYDEKGIRGIVDNKARWYPLVTMDWVCGTTLYDWVHACCVQGNTARLKQAADRWAKLTDDLAHAQIAHGSLDHSNVMVDDQDQFKLVDYDCMCVPELCGQRNTEIGIEPYEHPQRDQHTLLSLSLDHFSSTVIYVALRALAVEPQLWKEFVVNESYEKLLFRKVDLADPETSHLYGRLQRSPDPEVSRLSRRLIESYRADIEEVLPLRELLGPPPSRIAGETELALAVITDRTFSSHTIVTQYPTPIAVAYRRFCRQTSPSTRLMMLFATLESLLRYLVTLGVSDLFHLLAMSGKNTAALPNHADFDFLCRHKPMQLGNWIGALRESARALASNEGRFVQEFPEVCAPGGSLETEMLSWLVRKRNECIHTDGNISITPEECQEMMREVRPRLEDAIRRVGFLCRYPLGFVAPSMAASRTEGTYRYYLHSCMGTEVSNTLQSYVIETPAILQEHIPFVVAPDDSKLLYLWPLLQQRVAVQTGRHTLYMFEEITDRHHPCLSEIRTSAVDFRDSWRPVLQEPPRKSHRWLLARLRKMPPAPKIPRELRTGEKLLPTRGGKLVGRTLGQYRLTAMVAAGGFGTIYAAESASHGRVAVKVIESPLARRHFRRFQKEFERLRQASQHPGIIQCFEQELTAVDGREYPWYSLEFASGGDLAGRIRERADVVNGITWNQPEMRNEILDDFVTVASAVAHLHSLDIIHRDIKPGNVLIMDDGQLRVSDFGLAKNLDPSEQSLSNGPCTSTGAVLGTRIYMAPEQEQGRDVGKPADVYALGILLTELTTGIQPAANSHATENSTLANDKNTLVLPRPLRKFIFDCTDVDPDRRPPNAQSVCDKFHKLRQRIGEAAS